MLIIITRDQKVMDAVNSKDSGADAWKPVKQLSAGMRSDADKQMATLLRVVKSNEPLCITGHGCDKEVGDEGSGKGDWTWTSDELAKLLGGLVDGYQGPVLMEVCADSVTDFAARLAVALQDEKKLNGLWIYGYSKGVSVSHPFPAPSALSKNAELAGKQVKLKV